MFAVGLSLMALLHSLIQVEAQPFSGICYYETEGKEKWQNDVMALEVSPYK